MQFFLFALGICTVREPVGDATRGEDGSYLVTNPGLAQSLFITGIYDCPITKTQA